MINRAHAGLIDSHTERNRRDHDVAVALRPPVLDFVARFGRESGVISARRKSVFSKKRRDVFRSFLQRDVNDGRSRRALLQTRKQQLLALRRHDRRHREVQIGAIKSGVDGGGARDVEALANAVGDRRRRGRGQCEYSRRAKVARGLRQFQIIGAKIMSPFRNAMRLIDREKRDFGALQVRHESLVVEAFRRDVKQFQCAVVKRIIDGARFFQTQRRIESRRRDAATLQKIDLVFHQRN